MYPNVDTKFIDWTKLGQYGGTTSPEPGGTNGGGISVVYNNTADMDQYLAIFAN